MTTWATCGDGRPREAAPLQNSNLVPSNSDALLHNADVTPTNSEDITLSIEDKEQPGAGGSRNERLGLDSLERAEVGWRVKRIFDEGRVSPAWVHIVVPYWFQVLTGHPECWFTIYQIVGEVRERCFGTGKRTALTLLCKKCVTGKCATHRLERETSLN